MSTRSLQHSACWIRGHLRTVCIIALLQQKNTHLEQIGIFSFSLLVYRQIKNISPKAHNISGHKVELYLSLGLQSLINNVRDCHPWREGG